MCRIMCYLTKNGHAHKREVILHAIKASDKNGGHSIGILSIDDKGHATTRKYISSGEDATPAILKDFPTGRIILIHNRFATHGDVNETNAHPISKAGCHVIHNGIISNHDQITTTGEKVSQTDTECIIDLYLSTGRDPNTFHEHIHKLQGSKNFILYDEKKKRLIIYKDNSLDFSNSPTSGDSFVTSSHKQLIGKTGEHDLHITKHTNIDTLFGTYQSKKTILEKPYSHDFIELNVGNDYWVINTLTMKTTHWCNAQKPAATITAAYNTRTYKYDGYYGTQARSNDEYFTREQDLKIARDLIRNQDAQITDEMAEMLRDEQQSIKEENKP